MGSALLAFVALLLMNGSESGSSNTRRRSPTPAPSSHPADFDCPEEFGYYAHPNDCTQYYVCVFGGALLESCTGGLMYSHELQTCDWPRNVGCAAGSVSQVQQEPESRPRQRIQQTPQHIPKHDLYTEEEQLGPAEEIETDRQQRVYRGQPPTIGQVASDRDAISTHSNAIPIPSGRDKLSVVSYGNQQQYTRSKRLTRGGEITKDKSDHNFVTNTTRSRKKRHSLLRSPQDLGRDSFDGHPISWSTFQPRILYRRPQQTQNTQRQTYQRSPFIPSPVEYKFEPSDARIANPSPPPYTTPRQTQNQYTQSTTVRAPPTTSRYTTQSEESEEGEDYDEYEDRSEQSNESSPSTEGGFKPIFPNPPDSHYRESSEENPFASHDFDFDKFISQLRTQAADSSQTSTTPRYTTPKITRQPHFFSTNLIPSKGVQISSMYRPIASLISTTTPKPESEEYEDEYYDDYEDYDNKTYLSPPKAPKAPKRLQHLDNKEEDDDSEYDDSEEYYDDEEEEDEEEESEEQSERPVIKSASTMTENTKLFLDPTTPKYFTTTFLTPKCTNRGRNKCQTSTTTQKTRYRSTTEKTKATKTTAANPSPFTEQKTTTNPTLDLATRKKQRQRQNKSGTDGSTKDYLDKGHTQRALTRLRASVTPQQTYIEQQTPVPSRNYTQSRYVPSQYDPPFYNIYEDEVDLYKELANGDYQYNQNNQYRNQYKEKKPQIEIVQQEPLQRQTYSKNKYNTQSDVYQSVTPQEYDTYSIQTNDDIPYRQVQQKPSNRSEVKESESDGSERVVSAAVSPGLAQEEANAKTETLTTLSRDDKIVRDFLIQVAQTPSPFKLEESPVSLQTRGHFIVREPEVVNITPKPREQRKEEKRPIAIKIPDSAIDLNKYRNEPIRATDSLEWNGRRPSIPEKRQRFSFEEKQGDRGSSRFQESSYELEDFTEIPERQDQQEERHEARKEKERKANELARIKQIEEAEKQAREESRQKQIEEYRRKQYAEEQEKKKAIETQRLREIEQQRRKEAEEARRQELRRQEIEESRRKELEEKRRREFEEARRREQEDKRRKEVEEARRKELEEKRRKEIEEMRRKEIQEKEEARRKELEEKRRREFEEARRRDQEESRRKELEEKMRKEIEEMQRKEIQEKEEARRRQLEQIRREEEEEKQREAKRKAIEEEERSRMEAIKRELERQKQEETRRKVERPDGREQSYYYQTRKASSKIPERGFRIVVDTDDTITTRRPYTTDSKPPKKYLGRNSTLVNELYLNEQSTRLTPTPPFIDTTPQRMYTDQLRKTLDTPLPLSKTDPEKNLRVRPTTYDTQSTPGLTRGNSRHRGSHTYTVAPNEEEAPNRGTPSARGRPTLKPSTTVIAKASEYIDIYRYPAHRPSNVYPTPQVDKTAAKCRKDVCLLPDCSCGGKDIPGDLSPEETPQIVLLTFDDSVNDLNKGLYSDLFEKGRVNPNGCPIAGTFYVSHEWTDYSQVQNLYSTGHEIASHSVSHSFGEQFSQKKWTKEIAGQREILAAYGGVKLEDIRGMRAPFLAVGGNKMFKMLYDSNFTYDSSMPVYENRPPSWPYTLDYKIFHDCMIPPCPSRSYPGVWEVPMVMWQDLNGGRCSMGDACSNPPTSEGVYKMLIKNFERHFTTNRSPFGLFYHAAWFTQPHHKEGFISFLDTINKMPEVWIVTNWQAIQWVRDPTPISRLNSFAPFQCNYPDRPKKCNNPKVCNLWHKSGVRYMRTCQPCPDVYPWTGKSGVRNSRVDNEIIQE